MYFYSLPGFVAARLEESSHNVKEEEEDGEEKEEVVRKVKENGFMKMREEKWGRESVGCTRMGEVRETEDTARNMTMEMMVDVTVDMMGVIVEEEMMVVIVGVVMNRRRN